MQCFTTSGHQRRLLFLFFVVLFFSSFFLLPVHVVDSKGLLLINHQQSLNYDSGGATIEIAGYVHTG